MPSLRQLLADHAPLLVLDAASSRVQVGWLPGGGAPSNASTAEARWYASDEEAGVALFRGIEQLEVKPESVGAVVFCDGPGSVLGIRTAAMAIRTWGVVGERHAGAEAEPISPAAPVYAYTSLALIAHAAGPDAPGVIADARREAWHHYKIGQGLRRIPGSELTGALLMPENFRHWSALPAKAQVTRVPYSVAELLARPEVAEADLFLRTEAPDAFLHEEPSYVTWTPQIHRAPG